ncbi:MAG: nucleotidyltransferase family protein [Bacillota bacterium]
MKAIIMAGGRGTRLSPLTDNKPKPLVKIIDKPVLQHIIELLAQHGITEIGLTLGYKAEAIMEAFGNGSAMGVNLTYFVEREPLGTAGSVRACKDFIDGDVLVMSGDAYTNIDLTEAMQFHHKKRTIMTLIATPLANPQGLGVLKIDHNNAIIAFEEKPTHAVQSLINCGIYILSPAALAMIPVGKYDFGRDLLPRLLNKAHAYVTYKYWSDIGTLQSYYYTNYLVAGTLQH